MEGRSPHPARRERQQEGLPPRCVPETLGAAAGPGGSVQGYLSMSRVAPGEEAVSRGKFAVRCGRDRTGAAQHRAGGEPSVTTVPGDGDGGQPRAGAHVTPP